MSASDGDSGRDMRTSNDVHGLGNCGVQVDERDGHRAYVHAGDHEHVQQALWGESESKYTSIDTA